MALKPMLKVKVDELFQRWLSEPDTQHLLKNNLHQIIHGEALSQPAHISTLTLKVNSKPQSPRLRPSSPPPTKLLSPRRSHISKTNHRTINGNTKTVLAVQNGKDKEILSRDQPEKEKGNEQESTDILNRISDRLSSSSTRSSTESLKEIKAKKKDLPPSQLFIQNNINIPKFYFPYGKPSQQEDDEIILQQVSQEFSKCDGGKVYKHQMMPIAKVCNLPLYWKSLLFTASDGEKQGYITYQMFSTMWQKIMLPCHDEATRFVKLLSKSGSNYLDEEDFMPLLQDVVDTHPGLSFLQEAPEFHSRYVTTVISRIFFSVNRSWTGRITIPEIRKSNLLQTIAILEEEDDINQITDFFSYEHFYVIYCKFWELDRDHDLYIDKADLSRHNDHAISSRIIDRIFSGTVTRGKSFEEGKLSYSDFVWFLMAEEDKKHPTSVEYWFRCMDLDGDGLISMYEMEYFYEEQMQKMEALGIERLPFEDCLCQMIDLVRPKEDLKVTLTDLKNCKLTNIFFDTFFNLDKFLENEQRDPFANIRDMESEAPEMSDWERYAAEEYEILVAEEGANEQEEIHYEDDFEPEEEEIPPDEIEMTPNMSEPVTKNQASPRSRSIRSKDDIYDFGPQNVRY